MSTCQAGSMAFDLRCWVLGRPKGSGKASPPRLEEKPRPGAGSTCEGPVVGGMCQEGQRKQGGWAWPVAGGGSLDGPVPRP